MKIGEIVVLRLFRCRNAVYEVAYANPLTLAPA